MTLSENDLKQATTGMDAMCAATEVACAAAMASPTRSASGETPCSACGGTIVYRCDMPKRRRTFLQMRCRTPGCVRLIT